MNEYKTWTKQQIKDYGIRLSAKIQQARQAMKTETDILKIMDWISVIHDAEYVLDVMRKEYKK